MARIAASPASGFFRAPHVLAVPRKPLRGSDAVARFFLGALRKGAGEGLELAIVDVNGWPAIVSLRGGVPASALGIETDGARIYAVHVVVNPDKLDRIGATGTSS